MKCKDHLVNRDGCNPQRERKDPLKRIADEKNLESEDPAIKRAAEIKKQEDLAQQKIKALKYLGMMGCSCYDKDGSISDALVKAMDDCTPEVRMTAVQVVGGCICNEQYPRTCCKPKVVEKLADMAWGVDEDGNCKEPDPNIRAWAAYVAQQCCPGGVHPAQQPQPVEPEPMPTPPPPETVPGTTGTQPADRQIQEAGGEVGAHAATANPLVANLLAPEAGVRAATIEIIREAAAEGYNFVEEQPDANGDTVLRVLRQIGFGYHRGGDWVEPSEETREAARNTISMIDPDNFAANRPFIIAPSVTPVAVSTAGTASRKQLFGEAAADASAADEEAAPVFEVVDVPAPAAAPMTTPVASPVAAPMTAPVVAPVVAPQPAAAPVAVVAPPRPISSSGAAARGVVEMVDPARGTAMIRLTGQTMLPRGTRVVVYHKYVLGRLASVGEFEVIDAAPGIATVRGIAGTKASTVAIGDQAAASL